MLRFTRFLGETWSPQSKTCNFGITTACLKTFTSFCHQDMYKADLFILRQWIWHFTIASIPKSSCFSQQQNVHLVILFSQWPKWIGCCFIFWLQILDWTTNRQSLQCKLLHFLQQILVFVYFFTKVVQIWLLHFCRTNNSLILPLLSRSYRKQADEDRSVSITLCLGSQFQHPVMEPLQDVRRALVEINKCTEYLGKASVEKKCFDSDL